MKLGNPLYFKELRDDRRLGSSLAKPLESQDFASEGIEFCTYPSAFAEAKCDNAEKISLRK
jgi:hypothetical protein